MGITISLRVLWGRTTSRISCKEYICFCVRYSHICPGVKVVHIFRYRRNIVWRISIEHMPVLVKIFLALTHVICDDIFCDFPLTRIKVAYTFKSHVSIMG